MLINKITRPNSNIDTSLMLAYVFCHMHLYASICLFEIKFFYTLYLISRTPSRVLNFTLPYETLFHGSLIITFFCMFGCTCWPNLRPIIHTNYSHLDPNDMSSLAIAIGLYVKGTNVLIFSLVISISLGMSTLINNIFYFPNYTPIMVLFFTMKSIYLPTTLLNPRRFFWLTHVMLHLNLLLIFPLIIELFQKLHMITKVI
jgi:hypothetical protein